MAASGFYWVTEPEWFSLMVPSAPRVGEHVFTTSLGPLPMKQLFAQSPNLTAEIYY